MLFLDLRMIIDKPAFIANNNKYCQITRAVRENGENLSLEKATVPLLLLDAASSKIMYTPL